MDELIEHLVNEKVLKTKNIIRAFRAVDRADFVAPTLKNYAYKDEALPTMKGQTISQPYVVAFMMELLRPESGDKIMEIGFGSGWQTVLLAKIVGDKGRVFAVEIIPELCDFGKENISKYNFTPHLSVGFNKIGKNITEKGEGFIKSGVVEMFCKSGARGLPHVAEKIGGFDKIIVAAALADEIPKSWREQLKIHGTIVAPVKNSIWRFVKKTNGEFDKEEYPGFMFVPFTEKDNLPFPD